MRIADFPVPDTAAAHGALVLAREYHSPSILNHVTRSWLWAEAFASVEGFGAIDHELLYVAAMGLDISGARPDALPGDYLREVLAAHPRLALAREFGSSVVDQAERKPSSAACRLVDGGVVRKLRDHPLETLA